MSMIRLAMFAVLLVSTSSAMAKQPPQPSPDFFAQVLSDCLSVPRVTVHECVAEYLAAAEANAAGNAGANPDPSEGHASGSIIKGKYNTCRIYGKSEFHPGGNGYSC